MTVNARAIAHGLKPPESIQGQDRRIDILHTFLSLPSSRGGQTSVATEAVATFASMFPGLTSFSSRCEAHNRAFPKLLLTASQSVVPMDFTPSLDYVSSISVHLYKQIKAAIMRPGDPRPDTDDWSDRMETWLNTRGVSRPPCTAIMPFDGVLSAAAIPRLHSQSRQKVTTSHSRIPVVRIATIDPTLKHHRPLASLPNNIWTVVRVTRTSHRVGHEDGSPSSGEFVLRSFGESVSRRFVFERVRP